MTLRAVHSNRTEALLAALLDVLPPLDPFAPSTIVVGSHLITRWLSREIALARGIAAGLDLVTFDRFVARTWGDPREGACDRAQLAVVLASVLADPRVVARHPAVASYLEAAPAPGDRAGPRRVQLAEHLASLAWAYTATRPDWMPAFAAGRIPSELEAEPTARWQAALIGEALRRLGNQVPVAMLPWQRRRAGLPTPRVANGVAVFGVSFFSRAQLEALSDLAATTDVTVYLLDPCRELWDQREADDPLPLALWGRPVRDTLTALIERTNGDVDDRFTDSGELGEASGGSAREHLLGDVLARRPASVTGIVDAGVTVLACPNVRREVEIVADEVRRRLDADPTLRAHEIAVWIAGESERYLAQAPSAFEAIGVPCHLIDAPIDDRGRIGEAVLALLELPTSAMRRRDLLRVMTHPAVLAGHPHVDGADWVRWTERLGIVHGADGDAHDGTYLEDFRGHFHWDQGVRRLALGAFMTGQKPVSIADRRTKVAVEVIPEDVSPDEQPSAATYALLVRSLAADAEWLATLEQPLARWAELFTGLVDVYLAPRDEDAGRDLERVRAMLAGIAHLDIDGRPIGFREARAHAAHRLTSARANRGEPLASGVMLAPLSTMRAVPFRVVFVAGLDEGTFPAGGQPSPLDLRHVSRAGDVSSRDRDRHAFLEVLLGAREALYLSYCAVEEKSGQALGPSSVILELADALAPYLGAASSREALAAITRHGSLHRFQGVDAPRRERWAIEVRDAIRDRLRADDQQVPDEEGMFALLAHPSQLALRAALGLVEPPTKTAVRPLARPLTVSNLRGFLEWPLQAWAGTTLELDELPDDTVVDHSDEPFHLDRPDRAVLLREVFAAWLGDPARDVGAHYDAAVHILQLQGRFPVGVFATAARAIDLGMLERWRKPLGPIGTVTRVGFGRAHSPGAELHPALELPLGDRVVRLVGQTELLLRGPRYRSIVAVTSEVKIRSKYHLRGALDHLLLAAGGIANDGHEHVLVDRDGTTRVIQHAPWSRDEALAHLAVLAGELLDGAHGYLLPFESLVKALSMQPARNSWHDEGLGFGPIERPDGLDLPPDAMAMARRRLLPIVTRMTGDHGFEVRK